MAHVVLRKDVKILPLLIMTLHIVYLVLMIMAWKTVMLEALVVYLALGVVCRLEILVMILMLPVTTLTCVQAQQDVLILTLQTLIH